MFTAVIIEPRIHAAFEIVLDNFNKKHSNNNSYKDLKRV